MATRLHSRSSQAASRRVAPPAVVMGVAFVVVALALGAAALIEHRPGAPDRASVSRAGAPGSGGPGPASTTTATTALPPLTMTAVSPTAGTTGVALTSPITFAFSAPLTATTPDPSIAPVVSGHWAAAGNELTFSPTVGFLPDTHYVVTAPAATTGMEAGRSTTLAAAATTSFTAGAGNELRLQQLLAELHYLPLTFASTGGPEPTSAAEVAVTAAAGAFTWTYADTPASLTALWAAGTANVVTSGAVMAFESDHGLAVDGVAGPQVWAALVSAVAARQVDAHPYDYLSVTETRPETLSVWQNGAVVYTTAANTGVAKAATPIGTWPVYLRFASTTMRGTNPDGTKYVDPGIPWVAYFNGSDAVHGFVRASYGFPQSDGCVELPVAHAQVVWGMDGYGTLVTVS